VNVELTVFLTAAVLLTFCRYAPKAGSPTRTAVFAAAGIDGYMHHHFDGTPLKDFGNPGLVFLGEVGSEKDYIATRVS
jgi:acyl transferase domain-containing protein